MLTSSMYVNPLLSTAGGFGSDQVVLPQPEFAGTEKKAIVTPGPAGSVSFSSEISMVTVGSVLQELIVMLSMRAPVGR